MKGIKIEIENEQPMYLYRPYDVIGAIAYSIYYTANPDSEMCVPNCAYEKAEKVFEEWRDGTREKKKSFFKRLWLKLKSLLLRWKLK